MKIRFKWLRLVCLSALAGVGACATAPSDQAISQLAEAQRRQETAELNRQLALASVGGAANSQQWTVEEYRVGPGDVLSIEVFQVEDLSIKARVNGRGTVLFPLLGEVTVAALTPAKIEEELEALLRKDYLQDPQVSVFVDEFRSQQIAVMGAVKEPKVHEVRRPMTVLEVLSLSGGLNEKAGNVAQIQFADENAKTTDAGVKVTTLIIDFKKALRPGGDSTVVRDLVLRGGDSVFIPPAGVVFVEGAVKKPGSYALQGEVGVLAAIAMAGGTENTANEGGVQVFRVEDGSVIEVDLDAIRKRTSPEIELNDGDIVVVGKNLLYSTAETVWKGFTAIFNVGLAL